MNITHIVTALAILGMPAVVLAADPPALFVPRLTLDPTAAYPVSGPFSKGAAFLSLTGSYLSDVQSHTRENIYSNSVGIGWYPVTNLGPVAEIPVSVIHQDGPDTVGSGLDLLARYHFFSYEKLTLYADGGAGFLLSGESVPTGGTSFNFVERAGIGFTYQISPHWFLDAGSRVEHLSNAGFRGSEHNPSMNLGVQGYIGIMYRF